MRKRRVERHELPFELHVALRYLLAKRKQAFISVISLISTLGVTVGVMALVIALALMTGLQGELRDRILGSNAAHLRLEDAAASSTTAPRPTKLPQRAARDRRGAGDHRQGADHGAGATQAFISVKGIDPALEPTRHRHQRRDAAAAASTALDAADPDATPRHPARQGSRGAARRRRRRLGVAADAAGHAVADGHDAARRGGCASPASSASGCTSSTARTASCRSTSAKRLLDKDAGRPHPAARRRHLRGARRSPTRFPKRSAHDYVAQDWAEMNKSLFSALWLEKMAISLTIGLIVMVAALNIVASLILLVMEKSRDIAILKTMGASARSMTIDLHAAGADHRHRRHDASAASAASCVSRILDRYQLIRMPIDVYQVSYVPFMVLPRDFALVRARRRCSICFVATIYPSRQAARLDPAQALRYE